MESFVASMHKIRSLGICVSHIKIDRFISQLNKAAGSKPIITESPLTKVLNPQFHRLFLGSDFFLLSVRCHAI